MSSQPSHSSQNNVLQSPVQLPLDGSNLIEASAGTGKTYTIAALYIRFILAHIPTQPGATALRNTALLPPDILVVTYTKAATAELKDRIRQRLVEAATWFRNTNETRHKDAFLQQVRETYSEKSWPACAQALQTASEWMDEAAVKTIHSWCQSLLKEHAFSSGSLFTQELTTELQHFREDAARDYWREHVYPLVAEDFNAVIQVAKSPEALLKACSALWPMVANEVPRRIDITELRTTQERAYQAQVEEEYRRWQTMLPQILNFVDEAEQQGWLLNKRKVAPNATRKALKPISDWLELPARDAHQTMPKISSTLVTNYSRVGFAELISIDVAHLDFLDQVGELQKLAQQTPSIREPLLMHAAQWMKQRYYEALHQRALMSFDDIIQQCRHALHSPAGETLAEHIRAQFPVAMIDEFQDTDPDQYAIFNRLYRLREQSKAHAVYLIGDPKQAIYAFRGADIFTYLQARLATKGRHFTLARNFRSTAAMVAASNQVFMPAEQQQRKKAFLFNSSSGNQVPFSAVDAQGQPEQLVIDGKPVEQALTLWLNSNQDTPDKPLNAADYNASQAQACASYIVTLLNGANQGVTGVVDDKGGVTPLQRADIAVLVNNRFEGALVQQSLRDRGVASVYLSDRNSVFDSHLAPQVLRILMACAHPEQRQQLTNALYSPLLNLSVVQLAALQHDDTQWDQRVEQFYQYAQMWREQGVLAMIQRLIHDFDIAARLLNEPGGERDATDLLHIAELLQQAASQLDGELALIRYLRDKIYHPGTESSDEQTVRLESDSELVQIVTVHKSKGLEYPLVFLPFSSTSRPVNPKQSLFSYHNADGKLCHSTDPSPEILAQVNEERLGEEIRRLYVGLTRAKFATWASVAPVKHWEHGAFAYLCGAAGDAEEEKHPTGGAERFLAQAEMTWKDSDAIQLIALPAIEQERWQPPASEAASPQICCMPDEHQFKPWWVASYSALQYGAIREPESPAEALILEEPEVESKANVEAPSVNIHQLPRGAGPGTFLHHLLEDAAAIGFEQVARDQAACCTLVEKRVRQGPWLEYATILQQWLQQYLMTSFHLPGGDTCSLAALRQYQAEPEFWFSLKGVQTEQIDDLLMHHILPGHARPQLQGNYLSGMLKGFIDLVFEYEGRFYVADYKSNYLGPDDDSYQRGEMQSKILASRYDVQYGLYSLALHQLLKVRLGRAYSYERHFGGVVYLFLRGHRARGGGAFADRPSEDLLEQLGNLMISAEAEQGALQESY